MITLQELKNNFIEFIYANWNFFMEFFVYGFIFFYFFIIFFIIWFFTYISKQPVVSSNYVFVRIRQAYSFLLFFSYIAFIYPIIIGCFANYFGFKNRLFIPEFTNINFFKQSEALSRSTFNKSSIEFEDNTTFSVFNIFFDKYEKYFFDNLSLFPTLDCFKLYFIILANMVLFLCLMSFYNQIFDRSFYRIMNGYDYSSSTTAVSDEFEQNYVVSEKINKIFFLFFIFSLQLILHILFITDNIIYFFIAFEASVLPVFGIIGFFGKRSLKFKAMTYLLYFTLASAVPLICVISYIYVNSGTFYYSGIKFFFFNSQFSDFTYKLLFIGFFIPFAVKLAMFPFHTWLPEAHVEASTEGSMILSGIMLKLGFFGIVRFCLSFFPSITMSVAPFILGFCFIGAISTSFSMYKQLDIKKIIAYSSVVHMNIAIFGYFCGSHTGIEGALLFSFSHGVSSAGLFCAVGFLHDKLKTRNLMEISGLWVFMPRWSFFFLLLILANAGVPGTIGFIAEFSLICGIFEHFPVVALALFFPISIAAYRNYLLFTQLCMGVPSTYFGPYEITSSISSEVTEFKSSKNSKIFIAKDWDIHYSGEGVVLAFVSIFSVYTGVCPQFFISLLDWTAVYIELKFF